MSRYGRQGPILKALDGGCLDPEQIEREWCEAWATIATACECALTGLHPLHPRRDDLLALTRDAHLAARLPAEPGLRTA